MRIKSTSILGITMLSLSTAHYGYASDYSAQFHAEPVSQEVGEQHSVIEYLTLYTPSSLEATPLSTRTPFGQTGMGVLIFGVTDKNLQINKCDQKVTISYSEEKDGEQTLLRSLTPGTSTGGLMIQGVVMYDDYEFSNNPPVFTLFMFFASKEDSDAGLALSTEELAKYKKSGYYTVSIPDGAFGFTDGTLLKGATFTYHYDATEAPRDLSYKVTPASGSTSESAEELFAYNKSGIRVDFTGARTIDYVRTGAVATLTFPDGEVLKSNAPTGGGSRRYLSFTFGTRRTDWTQQGQYEFKILPETIGIDQGEYDEWLNDGTIPNFPGLTATYIVDDTVGVMLPGVKKSETYTVYTLGGQVLYTAATPGQVAQLTPGVYIINGTVTAIKK